MLLRYRVSLQGLKGFARVYELSSETTLYDFHKLLHDELEFPNDMLIQFKSLDAMGGLVARYSMFDLGYGTVDAVTLGDTVEKGIASFMYFYDVTNKKYVIVTCEGEVEPDPEMSYPALVETLGPNPVEFENGYVAYQDLPEDQKHPQRREPVWGGKGSKDDVFPEDEDEDDEVEDEDDEDDGDEDGKEIYDEGENAL